MEENTNIEDLKDDIDKRHYDRENTIKYTLLEMKSPRRPKKERPLRWRVREVITPWKRRRERPLTYLSIISRESDELKEETSPKERNTWRVFMEYTNHRRVFFDWVHQERREYGDNTSRSFSTKNTLLEWGHHDMRERNPWKERTSYLPRKRREPLDRGEWSTRKRRCSI